MDSTGTVADTAARLVARAAPAAADTVRKWSGLAGWYDALAPLWKLVVGALVGALVVALVTALVKLITYLFRDRHGVLARYRDYFGDELKGRHRFKFVAVRKEVEYHNGEPAVVQYKPLDAVISFVKSGDRLLVICAPFGLGKTRLLIEAARKCGRLRFVRTGSHVRGESRLVDAIRQRARKHDVVVFDDGHQIGDDLPPMVGAALERGAKVIIATRYSDSVAAAKAKAPAVAPDIRLGLMANAADILKVEPELAKTITRISESRPVFVVLAYQHYLRTSTLAGIEGKDDLLDAVFGELVAAGEKGKESETKAFLGELALRSGLWDDEEPMPGHRAFAARLREMGHLEMRGARQRQLVQLAPDALRDYVIRQVFAKQDILQDEFGQMLSRLPDEDAVNVIRMLAIQFREMEKDVWKQACIEVLKKYKGRSHEGGIGFTSGVGRKNLELLVDIGCEAWELFGDLRLVVNVLGDFCAGAERLESVAHLNRAGLFYMSTGEPDLALACHEQGLTVAEKDGDKTWAAVFLGNIGNVNLRKGEWDKALGYQERSLALERELGNKRGEAQSLGNIGLVWQLKGEWDKALEYHTQSAKLAAEAGSKQTEANQSVAVGLILAAKRDYDGALAAYERGLKAHTESGYKRGVAIALGNIGNVYLRKGELDKAMEYHEKAVKVFQELGAKPQQALALCNIGSVFGEQGRYEEAVPRLVEALGILIAVGAAEGPGQCFSGLFECYKAMGREKFIAACEKAGMSEEDIARLVALFDKKQTGQQGTKEEQGK